MLKKRIVGCVTVKNNMVVQSFSFNRYLPIGKIECIIENLDRWGVDEILIQVIDRSPDLGVDDDLLGLLKSKNIATPIIYSGGINSLEEALKAIRLGADRLVVDNLLKTNIKEVESIAMHIGAQALIGALPVSISKDNRCMLFDYLNNKYVDLFAEREDICFLLRGNIVSEIIVLDHLHEGNPGKFDSRIIEFFTSFKKELILFGGLGTGINDKRYLLEPMVSALAYGNMLNYEEHSVQKIKEHLGSSLLRAPHFLASGGI